MLLRGRQRVFAENLKNPADITILKIKRYGTGLTQWYSWYGGSGNGLFNTVSANDIYICLQ